MCWLQSFLCSFFISLPETSQHSYISLLAFHLHCSTFCISNSVHSRSFMNIKISVPPTFLAEVLLTNIFMHVHGRKSCMKCYSTPRRKSGDKVCIGRRSEWLDWSMKHPTLMVEMLITSAEVDQRYSVYQHKENIRIWEAEIGKCWYFLFLKTVDDWFNSWQLID